MKVTEVKYTKVVKPCGVGTTAVCFVTKDGRVLKLYLNTDRTKMLNKYSNLVERLEEINSIKNDTYIGPEEVLVKNDYVIGYLYPYIHSRSLRYVNSNVTMSDIKCNFDKLLEDTKAISDKAFCLKDLHSGNILFNGEYKVIDLDWGHIDDSNKYLLNINSTNVFKTILYSIFKVDPWEILNFNTINTQEQYRKTKWYNLDSINEFFEVLEKESNIQNPSIKQLRRTIKKEKYLNTYYKPGI